MALPLASSTAAGPKGASLLVHLFSGSGACICGNSAASAFALSSLACSLIQSACLEARGSNGNPPSHCSRARLHSFFSSSSFARAASCSNSSPCTKAWHCSHASTPGASSCPHRLQFLRSLGVIVDTNRPSHFDDKSGRFSGRIERPKHFQRRSSSSHLPGNLHPHKK